MAEDALRKELDSLKADLQQLRKDVGGLADAVRETAAARAAQTKARAAEELKEAREAVARRLQDATEAGRKAAETVEGQIREHPLSSLLAAFGFGLIIGLLTRSGGDRH